jgi:AcrR family transcriptional regulator
MTADLEPRLRADARRNRDQILAAARKMFAEQGPDAPMEEIADEAGVGVGTLYRRFPDRGALIGAVARDNFAQVLAETRAAAAEEPTAWDALARIVRQSRELQLSVQLAFLSPLAGAIIRSDPQTAEFRRELLETLDGVVRAAQAEGSLRQDVGTGDVAALLSLLLRGVQATPSGSAWLAADRALVLMLDGLRAQPGTRLPGHPLTSEDLSTVLASTVVASTVVASTVLDPAGGRSHAGWTAPARPLVTGTRA